MKKSKTEVQELLTLQKSPTGIDGFDKITGFCTSLTSGNDDHLEHTNIFISSLIDTWLFLRDIEITGKRNRGNCCIDS